MDKYIYMTVYQFADAIASAPWNTLFDFTYDSKQCEDDIPDPTGWYGIKITQLFDEEGGVLCYGYYGGGCNQAVELYIISDDIYDVRENQKAIERQFREWSEYAYDKLEETVCVAVTDNNRRWIEEVI